MANVFEQFTVEMDDPVPDIASQSRTPIKELEREYAEIGEHVSRETIKGWLKRAKELERERGQSR